MKNFNSLLILVLFLCALPLAESRGETFSGPFPKHFATLRAETSHESLRRIKVGFSLFAKPWVQAPSSTKRRDGLGPYFNAVSCMSCHQGMGRGAPPGVLHDRDPALVLKAANDEFLEAFGAQLNPRSLPGLKEEGWHENVKGASGRIAPHVAGLGYLELIPEEEILKNLQSGGLKGEGRFGWKAQHGSIRIQVADAFFNDMGITSSLHPENYCHVDDLKCFEMPDGADEEGVEIRDDHLDMVVEMIQSIEAPKRLGENKRGEEIFSKINCNHCHRKTYEIDGKEISPYTDLLLHDMGARLSDPGNSPLKNYWRTPPLWGLGSQRLVNGHERLLHDGRANGIREAILLHGGEADSSKNKFLELTESEKEELERFLRTL